MSSARVGRDCEQPAAEQAHVLIRRGSRCQRRLAFGPPARSARQPAPSMDKNSLMGSQSLNYRLDFQLVYRVRGE